MSKALPAIKLIIALLIILVAITLVIFPAFDAILTFFDIAEYAIDCVQRGASMEFFIEYTMACVRYVVIESLPHVVYALLAALLGIYFTVDSIGGLIKKSPKKQNGSEQQQ